MSFWNIWQKKKCYPFLVRPFYLVSVTLLSLLLPLSFLLLARLSSAHYLLSLASNPGPGPGLGQGPDPAPESLLSYIFLYTNPNLLHGLVSVVTLAALVNALMGRISPLSELPGPIFQPGIHVAWVFLCTLQVCVGLGIETTIKAGAVVAGDGNKTFISKLVFFLGLHETMIQWCRAVVRPVVDDTVFGGPRKERWGERWALAATFGALSWWRLRDEVESLVVVVELKRDLMIKVGLGDFLGWWLYYLTVAIGMARILKAIMWFCMLLFCTTSLPPLVYDNHIDEDDSKV